MSWPRVVVLDCRSGSEGSNAQKVHDFEQILWFIIDNSADSISGACWETPIEALERARERGGLNQEGGKG